MSERPALTDLEKSILDLRDSMQTGIGDRATLGRLLFAVNNEVGKILRANGRTPTMQRDLVDLQSAVNVITTGVGASDERKARKGLEDTMFILDEMKSRASPQKNL